MDTTTIILPPDMPLMAKTADAAKLFGVGRTTLYKLRRDHHDYRALTIKTGREVLFDVPQAYRWFQQYGGGELEG
jgi:hypothetical protein